MKFHHAIAACVLLAAAHGLASAPLLAKEAVLSAVTPSASKSAAEADSKNALRWGSVQIQFEALRNLALSEAGTRQDVSIEPFEGVNITLDGESLFVNDSATIVGRLKDGESGIFILSWGGTIFYGMLEAGLSRFIFESNPEDPWGTLRVKEIDSGSFFPCAGEFDSPQAATRRDMPTLSKQRKPVAKTQPANHTVVEYMALYTPDMAANHSGDPAAYINTLEASWTAAMSNSSVTGSARVVRYKEYTYSAETYPFAYSDFGVARAALLSDSGMYSSRQAYRADLVALLIDGDDVGNDGSDPAVCGRAETVDSATPNTIAFAVVSDACAAGDLTFAHEMTHLLGGRHDWGDPTINIALDDDAGWTPGTGHGYTNSSPNFRTVMAGRSGCSFAGGCPRLSRYSDPDQTATISGTPYALGVADDWSSLPGNQRTDVVDVLANSVEDVAGYMYSGDAAPGQPASMTVDRLCGGYNELSWPTPSGTTGWYEVQSSSNSGYSSAVDEYRGGQESLILYVTSTKYVRVRACNAEGCGSWRNGGLTATTTCP